jgi:hypothetical protein
MYHLLSQSVTVHFVFVANICVCFSVQTATFFLISINQMNFVMVRYGVLSEVLTEILNFI